MDLAITGSSGLIGRALARTLARDGHRVVRLVRPETGEVGGNAVAWDPRNGTIDRAGLEDLGAVVHLAGAGIGDRRWTRERKSEILRSRTEGTELLASTLASLSSPPDVFVSGSATGYYGEGGDRELTESSEAGRGFRAGVVKAWEGATSPALEAGIRTVLLRSANVLTPEGGLLPFLLTPFRFGLGARFGSGRQWFPWITLDDEVAVIRFAIENRTVRGPVNAAAPEVGHEPGIHGGPWSGTAPPGAVVGSRPSAASDRRLRASRRGPPVEREGGARRTPAYGVRVCRSRAGAGAPPHARYRGGSNDPNEPGVDPMSAGSRRRRCCSPADLAPFTPEDLDEARSELARAARSAVAGPAWRSRLRSSTVGGRCLHAARDPKRSARSSVPARPP